MYGKISEIINEKNNIKKENVLDNNYFNENNNSSINYELLLTVAKNEYDESFKHREKLDTKINILFTAYAFIVLIYVQLISSIDNKIINDISKLILEIFKNKIISIKLFLFLIGFIVSTIFIIFNVLSLLCILKGIILEHFDSSEILDKNMFESCDKVNVKYIIALYEKCKFKNNDIINDKFLEYNKAINRTIIMIIVIIFTYLLKLIL